MKTRKSKAVDQAAKLWIATELSLAEISALLSVPKSTIKSAADRLRKGGAYQIDITDGQVTNNGPTQSSD